MNTPPEIPKATPQIALTYEVTRWDLFLGSMTILFRNRILQVFVIVGLLVNGYVTLASALKSSSGVFVAMEAIGFVVIYLGFLIACLAVFGLATSFLLKQRGVVGRHVLEVTEQGLIERTDFNENLHKWPSVCRLVSMLGYLFVYVGDMNYHLVPRHNIPPEVMARFEAEVRARAGLRK